MVWYTLPWSNKLRNASDAIMVGFWVEYILMGWIIRIIWKHTDTLCQTSPLQNVGPEPFICTNAGILK